MVPLVAAYFLLLEMQRLLVSSVSVVLLSLKVPTLDQMEIVAILCCPVELPVKVGPERWSYLLDLPPVVSLDRSLSMLVPLI